MTPLKLCIICSVMTSDLAETQPILKLVRCDCNLYSICTVWLYIFWPHGISQEELGKRTLGLPCLTDCRYDTHPDKRSRKSGPGFILKGIKIPDSLWVARMMGSIPFWATAGGTLIAFLYWASTKLFNWKSFMFIQMSQYNKTASANYAILIENKWANHNGFKCFLRACSWDCE